MRVGVLALQGAVSEHLDALKQLNCQTRPILYPRELAGLDGLVIPGGESTTLNQLLTKNRFTDKIKAAYFNGMGIFGTCAGCILLAKNISGGKKSLALMDISVERNAYGRQVDSFEADIAIDGFDIPYHGIFIRAPVILSADGNAKIMAKVGAYGTMAVQGRLLVTTFHPELTDDLRIHSFFLNILNRLTVKS